MKKSEPNWFGWRRNSARWRYWPAPRTEPVAPPYHYVDFIRDDEPTRCWAHADHYYWDLKYAEWVHCEREECGFGCLNDSQTDVGLCAHHYEEIFGG